MATASLPNPHHRKIELQSPLDLTHLQTQLTTSARQKLDLHFPPSALRSKPATHISLGGPESQATTAANATTQSTANQEQEPEETDPLRQHVQSLLTSFLHRTWSSAAQSITINGLDAHTLPQFSDSTTSTKPNASDPALSNTSTTHAPAHPQQHDQQYDQQQDQEQEGIHYTLSPYDSRLQTRLASLYGELESLTAQVSKLRREAPGRGAEMLRESLGREIEGEEAAFEAAMQVVDQKQQQQQQQGQDEADPFGWGKKQREGGGGGGGREGWYEEVKNGYEGAVAELARLSGHRLPQEEEQEGGGQGGGGGGGGSGPGSSGGLTGCVGKVQRARTVAEELE